MTKRKRSSAEFTAKGALDAIREDLIMAELPRKDDIYPILITGWTRTAILNMASAFRDRNATEPTISDQQVGSLHARIGQLVVERDFLSAASSLILDAGGKRR